MKKLISILFVLLIGFGVYWFFLRSHAKEPGEPKQQPIAVKQHSDSFNLAVDAAMTAYLNLKDAVVQGDTALAKKSTQNLVNLLDSIPLKELDKESSNISETAKLTIGDIKTNAEALIAEKDITMMRQDFRAISDMLYPAFFKVINYEGQTLYLQNCPMAFGEDKDANWISNSPEIVNPYLGINHPEFKATMLHCGEVKDSIVAGK